MNENKTPLVVSILSLLLGLGLLIFGGHGSDAQTASQVRTLQDQVQQLVARIPKTGALASPALGPWFSYGEIIHDGSSADVTFTNTATSSACSILSPAATSTLSRASLRVVSEPYANTWVIYKAVVPSTKTTLLAQNLVGATGAIIATTTVTTLTDGVVPPLSWINFLVSTTTAVNNNFNAIVHCEAAFLEL